MCDDGFGQRRLEHDSTERRFEVLTLAPSLSTPSAERVITGRAARLTDVPGNVLARVVGIAREGERLAVSTEMPDGVPLADVLASLEFGTIVLPDAAILELAGNTLRALAALHARPGAPAHGAITPAHIYVGRDGRAVLTGGLFAEALQGLQYNREQLWRTFSIALPPSATLPRFDHRADVAQVGAVVVAILLRRPLTAGEYPRGAAALVVAAARQYSSCGSALRLWMEQTLQLHPKALFASAAEATQAFYEAIAETTGRRAGAHALQMAIRRLSSEDHSEPEEAPPVRPPVTVIPPQTPPLHVATPLRGLAFLRTVFPPLRAN